MQPAHCCPLWLSCTLVGLCAYASITVSFQVQLLPAAYSHVTLPVILVVKQITAYMAHHISAVMFHSAANIHVHHLRPDGFIRSAHAGPVT